MGVHVTNYYGHCNNKWHCIYIPLLVVYSIGFLAVLVVRIKDIWLKHDRRKESSSSKYYHRRRRPSSLSSSSSGRWPPRCLRRDVCLWPSYVFLTIFIPALLWPLIVATALVCFAGYLIVICLGEVGRGARQTFLTGQSCCGIPLRRRGGGRRGANGTQAGSSAGAAAGSTSSLEDMEHGYPGPECAGQRGGESVISKPEPTYGYTQASRMYG